MPGEGTNRSGKGSAALAEAKQVPLDRAKGTAVAVGGEEVLVGKLSLNQLIAAIRQILSAAVHLSPEQRMQLTQAGSTANFAVLLAVLDEKTINRVFSIILDRSEEWCGEHLDALSALDVLDAVLEHNDWDQLRASFLRLQQRFKRSQTSSA